MPGERVENLSLRRLRASPPSSEAGRAGGYAGGEKVPAGKERRQVVSGAYTQTRDEIKRLSVP